MTPAHVFKSASAGRKIKNGTVIIQNDGTLEDLLLQVKHAWETDVPDIFRMAIRDENCV